MNKQTMVDPNPAMKRSGLLRSAPTWMNLEVICLNGKNQSQKITYYGIPLIGHSKT